MRRLPAAYDVARGLYRYAPVRRIVHRYGPAYWRLPAVYRGRLVRTSELRRLRGVEVTLVGDREHVTPASVERPPSMGHRIAARPFVVPRPFYAVLENVWLVGEHGAVVTRDGQLVLSSFRDEPGMLGLEAHPDLEQFLRDEAYRRWPSRPVGGLTFSTVGRLDVNYFHWLIESCGQLETLEIFAARAGERPSMFVRAGGPSFQRESLRLLGWPDVTEWEASLSPLAVERLVLAAIPGIGVATSPSSTKWLRARFIDCVPKSSADATTPFRLYVPRPTGGWRYVANDERVRSILESNGFVTLEPSTLTFEQQVRIFMDAKTIAGQHGAALTNMLFATDASVIEFVGGYGGGEYYSLASSLGHRYSAVLGVPSGDALLVPERDLESVLPTPSGSVASRP